MSRRIVFALPVLTLLLLANVAHALPEPTGPWHPEITAYPRLFFSPGDVDELRDRVERQPYTTLMNRVRSRAAGGWSPTVPDTYDVNRENSNGDVAKCAAFTALIDENAAMAEKAASILEVLATDFGTWSYELVDDDIHIAEAMHGYVTAFDFLAGSGYIDDTRLDAIAARLGTMVANLYTDYCDTLAWWGEFSLSNHHIKIDGALGMAGMVLNDRDDALKWVSFAVTEGTHRLYDVMLAGDGAYGEGPGYGTYSALQHLPFILAYDRLVGETETLYERDFCLAGPGCTWSEVEVANPLDNPLLHAMSRWYVDIRMPDGAYAPVDDANQYGFFNGLVAAAFGDGVLAWDWLENDRFPLYSNYINELAPELIAFYDDALEASPPDFTHVVEPDRGYAVFRTGWEADDAWAMMLAEHGGARLGGLGHEQGDNLSVTLFNRGRYLLIDPGYIEWSSRWGVAKGNHHNVPTVNTEGPPSPIWMILGGTDAFITDAQKDGAVAFARGASSWYGAKFERMTFFAEDDYVIVLDRMNHVLPRTFGVTWNGVGGGDTGDPYALLGNGARWEPDGAGVEVRVAGDKGSLVVTDRENQHGWTWSQTRTHRTLDVRAPYAANGAAFVSAGLPYVPGVEDPRGFSQIPVDGAAAVRVAGDAAVFALAQPNATTRSFTKTQTGSLALSTNARFAFAQVAPGAKSGGVYIDANSSMTLGSNEFRVSGGRVFAEWRGVRWAFRFGDAGGTLSWSGGGTVTGSSGGVRAIATPTGTRIEATRAGWITIDASTRFGFAAPRAR